MSLEVCDEWHWTPLRKHKIWSQIKSSRSNCCRCWSARESAAPWWTPCRRRPRGPPSSGRGSEVTIIMNLINIPGRDAREERGRLQQFCDRRIVIHTTWMCTVVHLLRWNEWCMTAWVTPRHSVVPLLSLGCQQELREEIAVIGDVTVLRRG